MRIKTVYITREILEPAISTSVEELETLFTTKHCKADIIEYITEKGSKEIETVKHLTDNRWHINEGFLNREYISQYISGLLKEDNIEPNRVTVLRVPKKLYIEESLKHATELEESYPTDEDLLQDIPIEKDNTTYYVKAEKSSDFITIAGEDSWERTLFALIIAQYIALKSKVILIEKDFDYLKMSDLVSRLDAETHTIDIEYFFKYTEEAIEDILSCRERLICLISTKRRKYSYNFICNLLYNNIDSRIPYIVCERDFKEVATTDKYVAVFANNIISILKMVTEIPDNYKENCVFVAISCNTVVNIQIENKERISILLKDLLQMDTIEYLYNYRITNINLGGETIDLQSILERLQT